MKTVIFDLGFYFFLFVSLTLQIVSILHISEAVSMMRGDTLVAPRRRLRTAKITILASLTLIGAASIRSSYL